MHRSETHVTLKEQLVSCSSSHSKWPLFEVKRHRDRPEYGISAGSFPMNILSHILMKWLILYPTYLYYWCWYSHYITQFH